MRARGVILSLTLVIASATAALPAGAQSYYDGPGYYPPQYIPPPPRPRRYYREPYYAGPPYGGPPPGYYYQPPPAPFGAPARVGPGDPGYQPWRPRFDPRNGGYYCVQQGFTVQDGVCRPGRY